MRPNSSPSVLVPPPVVNNLVAEGLIDLTAAAADFRSADGRKPLRQPALECIEPALERPRLTELVAHGPGACSPEVLQRRMGFRQLVSVYAKEHLGSARPKQRTN